MQSELRSVAQKVGLQDDRGAFLDILELDPKNAQAFENLGSTLLPGQSLQLPDGLLLPKKALHLKALELDSTHSHAHNNLAVSLSPGEVITLPGSFANATQQSLFQRAVELDPRNAVAHCNLGVVLEDRKVIRLEDGTLWDKRSLYIRSIELDPSYAFAYNNLAVLLKAKERVPLADGSSWDRQRLYLAALELDPSYAVAYNNLALTLTSREKVQGPGGIWDRKSLHQKALELDPRHICAYRDLALALIEKDRIFLQGRWWKRRELLLEALRLDSNFANAYQLLSETLSAKEELMVNGKSFGKTELLVQALQLDPEPVTCALLGAHLGSGACHLKGWPSPATWFGNTDGPAAGHSTWTGAELMQRALQLAPKCPRVLCIAAREVAGGAKTRQLLLRAAGCGSGEACGRLALLMAPKERVRISQEMTSPSSSGMRCSRQQLLQAACELVDDAQLWLELSLELAPFERVTLRGEIYDARALCREALQLDPSHPGALRQLQAHQAGSADAIPRPLLLRHAVPDLFEGGCSDWQEPSFAPSDAPQELDAFVLALGKMEQAQAEPDILGECLGPSERVRLSSGDGWHYRSRSQLHKAALESDALSSRTWTNLGVTLVDFEFQGHHYTQEDMFERALELDPENKAAAANLASLRGERPKHFQHRPCRASMSGLGKRRCGADVKHLVEASLLLQEKACKLQPSAARRLRMANAMVVDSDRLDGRHSSDMDCAFHIFKRLELAG
ncbi:unnamed protein product [Durusdinium trenchii]|uniref:Uncharacterized protein n=1 Tax=Durusdinium trenchii TaxID=1381693 RepID=A0ABP0M6X3_9DINO